MDSASTDRVASLLAQFPGPVRLPASRWKWLGLLAGGALFTGCGIAWIIEPGGSHVFAGWFGAIFFGIATAVTAVAVLPGGFEIVLDRDGFTMCIAYRRRRWRWADVGDFAVIDDPLLPRGGPRLLRKRVGFNDKRAVRDALTRAGERLNEMVMGCDYVLPDSFGLTSDECVRLLSLWQQRALASPRESR